MTKPKTDREWQIFFEALEEGIILGEYRRVEIFLMVIEQLITVIERELDEKEGG